MMWSLFYSIHKIKNIIWRKENRKKKTEREESSVSTW